MDETPFYLGHKSRLTAGSRSCRVFLLFRYSATSLLASVPLFGLLVQAWLTKGTFEPGTETRQAKYYPISATSRSEGQKSQVSY